MNPDDCNDSDSELISNDSIIGKILIQMKSEFNKGPVESGPIAKKSNELPETVSEENGSEEKNGDDVFFKSTEDNQPSCNGVAETEINTKNLDAKVIKDKTQNLDAPDDLNDSDEIDQSVEIVSKKNKAKVSKMSSGASNEESDEVSSEEKELNHKERKRDENFRPPARSSLRNRIPPESATAENQGPKRSSRRLSKDFGETVLQSAIARKEKSYNETAKPQRLSRRLKANAKRNSLETITKNTRNKRRNSSPEKSSLNEEVNVSVNEVDLTPSESNSDTQLTEVESVDSLPIEQKNTADTNGEIIEDVNISSPEDIKINGHSEISVEIENESNEIPTVPLALPTECKKPAKRRKVSETNGKEDLEIAKLSNGRRRSSRIPPSPQMVEPVDKVPPKEPECTTFDADKERKGKLCLCLKRTKISVEFSNMNEIFCTGVDSINGKCIGCNNMADVKDIRRPSTRVPFLILCTVHFQRLIRHNCCPGCGMFCTEGVFVACGNGHQYHRECISIIDLTYESQNLEESHVYCLHCGSTDNQIDVHLTIKTLIKPAFLPFQRSYYPAAKMGFYLNENSQSSFIKNNGCYLEIENFHEIPKLCSTFEKGSSFFSPDNLYEAAETGDNEKLMKIIATGMDLQQSFDAHDGDTVLHAACTGGHKIAAYLLLSAGASINAINASQKTPLMNAILGFQENILNFLIKNGANISFKGPDGMTSLHLAAKIGFLNGCKILVAASNTNKQFIDGKDDGGWTPLVWACEHAHRDVAEFLLWRGADPHVTDLEHNVPLHWAAFGGNGDIMDMLITLGVDVNAKNVHKETPLHIAARQDQYDGVFILLAHKALPDCVNLEDETPLDCCHERSEKCRDLLALNIQLRSLFAGISSKDPILTNDVSNGKELNPIQCVNFLDNESKPTDYVYITENCVTSEIKIDRRVTTLQSCVCEDKCGTQACQCNNTSLRCWYDDQERLLPEFDYTDPPMIFECNQLCSCNAITCKNRVVQRGLTQRFQIFRTETKGWGVKTLRFIQRGTYVCEYIGELLPDLEADQREDDSYLFDLDNREGDTYCIDAKKYGNLSRFINHHCAPNILPIRVFIDHHDLHFPRIAFFANRDIAADEELGFDYGEKFWIIKYKSFTCTCGADNCRYSDSTIESTLKEYQMKEEQIALQQKQLNSLSTK